MSKPESFITFDLIAARKVKADFGANENSRAMEVLGRAADSHQGIPGLPGGEHRNQ